MIVRKMMPMIVEDTDPPFGPVAVMKYDDDGLCVSISDYAELEARYNPLRDAVKRLVVADDDLLKSWDAMANNVPLEDEYHAARAEVDRLLEEG